MKISKEDLRYLVLESVRQFINEAKAGMHGEDDRDYLYESRQGLKSKKLYDIINQYGLPQNHLHPKSIFGISDFHNMTDADVIGAVPYEKVHSKNQKELNGLAVKNGFSLSPADMVEVIELNNGMALLVINRNGNFDRTSYQQEGGFKDLRKKQSERDSRRSGNGSRQYQWKSPTADETFHNPYFKRWSPEGRKNQMDNIRKDYQK